MGGGNHSESCRENPPSGLSPRGRGKPKASKLSAKRKRSIPAWAGETRSRIPTRRYQRVYPRVGGGNSRFVNFCERDEGLSPRGRGKRLYSSTAAPAIRSIPAWAGETPRAGYGVTLSAVYPRVGGGNRDWAFCVPRTYGLSPRGRGKPVRLFVCLLPGRSIPAWAGETFGDPCAQALLAVYPRVGGGNGTRTGIPRVVCGLSPRGRGKLERIARTDRRVGSIPAWAGETSGFPTRNRRCRVYPRVGGGNRITSIRRRTDGGLSPRGRGKRGKTRGSKSAWRSIPAWAGETTCIRILAQFQKVYPRVGGGNSRQAQSIFTSGGLSPRGRGKPVEPPPANVSEGSIPAWAGETPGVT